MNNPAKIALQNQAIIKQNIQAMSETEHAAFLQRMKEQIFYYHEWVLPFLKPQLAVLPKEWKQVQSKHPALIAFVTGSQLKVIISGDVEEDGNRWIHLSMSRPNRIPHWNDIKRVKSDFLGDETPAIQVFPPKDEWINHHEFVLHLWVNLDARPFPDFRRNVLGVISI